MPTSLNLADQIATAINTEFVEHCSQAIVGFVPETSRKDVNGMECYVMPQNRLFNETEGRDGCAPEMASQVVVTFIQRIIPGEGGIQPGSIHHIRIQIDFVERVAEWFMKKKFDGFTIDKSSVEQQLYDSEMMRQQVFKSEMVLTYG